MLSVYSLESVIWFVVIFLSEMYPPKIPMFDSDLTHFCQTKTEKQKNEPSTVLGPTHCNLNIFRICSIHMHTWSDVHIYRERKSSEREGQKDRNRIMTKNKYKQTSSIYTDHINIVARSNVYKDSVHITQLTGHIHLVMVKKIIPSFFLLFSFFGGGGGGEGGQLSYYNDIHACFNSIAPMPLVLVTFQPLVTCIQDPFHIRALLRLQRPTESRMRHQAVGPTCRPHSKEDSRVWRLWSKLQGRRQEHWDIMRLP